MKGVNAVGEKLYCVYDSHTRIRRQEEVLMVMLPRLRTSLLSAGGCGLAMHKLTRYSALTLSLYLSWVSNECHYSPLLASARKFDTRMLVEYSARVLSSDRYTYFGHICCTLR